MNDIGQFILDRIELNFMNLKSISYRINKLLKGKTIKIRGIN